MTGKDLRVFFFSSRRRHTRCSRDWSSDVCSSDLTLYSTRHTSRFLEDHGVPNIRLYKIHERRKPSLLESISPDRLDLIINVPSGYDRKELTDGYIIRRRATDVGIPLIPNLQIAELFVKTIASKRLEDLRPRAYDEYVRGAGKGPKARSGLVLESEDAGAGGSLAHADRTSGRPSMRDASPSNFRGGTRNPQNP